jgi:hypothetical protein
MICQECSFLILIVDVYVKTDEPRAHDLTLLLIAWPLPPSVVVEPGHPESVCSWLCWNSALESMFPDYNPKGAILSIIQKVLLWPSWLGHASCNTWIIV